MQTWTSTSEHFGALSPMGELWNASPRAVFLFVFFIDFGVISALMAFEELRGQPRLARGRFLTFIINDTLVIPPFLAVAAYTMQRAGYVEGWYTQPWWHYLALAIGFGLSFGLEAAAIKTGQFTWRQELSPSKLWHTIVFGLMGYWMITGLVASLSNPASAATDAAIWGLTICWIAVVAKDADRGLPQNAHCEWSWRDLRPVRWPDDHR